MSRRHPKKHKKADNNRKKLKKVLISRIAGNVKMIANKAGTS